jgi:hypothetical protein
VWGRFEDKAFLPLIDYYFHSGFSGNNSREELYRLTVEYENLLKNIYSEQSDYKKRIEEYHGENWDLLYGKNALWRKFDSLVNQTSYLIANCLFHRALCVEGEEFDRLSTSILQRCEAITGGVNGLYRDMLEARVYMLMREADEGSYDMIFKRLERVEMEMTADTELYYQMWLCRLELLKPFSVTQLNRIVDNFKGSAQQNNPLIAMRLAFLQRQVGESGLLQTSLEKWPPLADVVASMLYEQTRKRLSEKKATEYISSLTHFERQLLAWFSLKEQNYELDKLIASFGVGKEKADRVLSYVAAVKTAQENPQIAVDSVLNALSKPAYTGKIFSGITDLQVLTVGVKAGFVLLEDEDYTEKVVNLFNRYKELAGENAQPSLVFAYAAKLQKIRPGRAHELLTEIYEDGGEYADKALFELLVADFNNDEDISERIQPLYERVKKTDKAFVTDVTDLYCRYLGSVGRSPRALQLLREGYEDEMEFHSGCGLYVLEKFLERAEEYIQQDGKAVLDNALFVARRINMDQEKLPSIRLVFIETASLASLSEAVIGEMPEYQDQFSTLLFSRAKARYLSVKGEYFEAAFIWGKIAKSLFASDPVPQWRWQRAKFYQIECSGKSEEVDDEELLHSIEVLQADSNWHQGYWARRLEAIKPELPQPQPAEVQGAQEQSAAE